jgi:hypothetical protein
MPKERVTFLISIASSVAVSYIMALIAYGYSEEFGLFEETKIIAQEAHVVSRLIYGTSAVLVVTALISLVLHYVKPDRPKPTAFVTSVLLVSSLICIGSMSWFMFA